MKQFFLKYRHPILANIIIWSLHLAFTLPVIMGIVPLMSYHFDSLIVNLGTMVCLYYLTFHRIIPYFETKNNAVGWFLGLLGLILGMLLFRLFLDQFHYYGMLLNGQPFSQHNIRLTNFTMVVVVSSMFKFLEINERRNEALLQRENKKLEAELGMLKNQINPHFLFNTLNNIYSFTYLKDERAPVMITKLSEIMRYMLYECRENRVPLQKEVNLIKNYLDLEQLKNEDRIMIDFYAEGVKNYHNIAPLILITFIENCFKHGDWEKNKKAWISIELEVTEQNELAITIANSKTNKVGTPSLPQANGLGLENAKQQLLLNYPENHILTIAETDNSYTVQLKIKSLPSSLSADRQAPKEGNLMQNAT